ncbi:MAG: hypothetical protein CMJ85_10385 [Planctomycetes bacterium]|nr:hypothetical protein [Planctomycetota bacterium]
MRVWHAPELSATEREALRQVLAGGVPVEAEVVQERFVRRVLRMPLGDRVVFAKQHLFPRLAVRARYWLRASPTAREVAMLRLAAQRGVVVPQPLAEATERGLLGPTSAVLVTEELAAGTEPGVEDLLHAVLWLAEHGVFHPDMHGDNVRLLTDAGGAGRYAFLDFQSCSVSGGAVRGRRLAWMIGKAMAWLTARGALPEPVLRSLTDDTRLVDAALQVAGQLKARCRASRARHRLRDSTLVCRERVGLLGCRLRLRGSELPQRFDQEVLERTTPVGAALIAVSGDGSVVRVRRRGLLRTLWMHGPLADRDSGFLAWERIGPWPWAQESLYICGSMGSSGLRAAWEGVLADAAVMAAPTLTR